MTPLLCVEHLGVTFGEFAALTDISFDIHAAETVGLVGESGSGKSTLARALLRLVPATSGRVLWRGDDLLQCGRAQLRRRRRDLQIVFQDPMASLNPRLRVGDALGEPLRIFESELSRRDRERKVSEMLQRVGLSADMALRYPHEFSGGQCQRIGIARAMMLRPKLLICDEPVSSLDVSIQGQIVNLLADLQQELAMAVLFISHNLAVVRHLSHRVLVIYRGRLVEMGDRDTLFAAAAHPYTRALFDAVPDPTRHFVSRALTAVDEAPSGANVACGTDTLRAGVSGCSFHGRCPHARPLCVEQVPVLEEVAAGHRVACHRWREIVHS